jgi:hypothetical protein
MAKNEAVVGLVPSRTSAEHVVMELQRAGFSGNDISVLFPDNTGTRDFAHEQHTKAPEGAAIPGVGPLIAAGPIMAALSGAAAGALVGGLGGALIGLGIPEIEAKQYEGKIKDGNILLSVHVESSEERDRAKEALKVNVNREHAVGVLAVLLFVQRAPSEVPFTSALEQRRLGHLSPITRGYPLRKPRRAVVSSSGEGGPFGTRANQLKEATRRFDADAEARPR